MTEDQFRNSPAQPGNQIVPASRNLERPVHKGGPYPKGVSGNPSGMSKAQRDVTALAREHGPEAILALVVIGRTSQDDKARIAAWDKILDRAYGKPTQKIDAEIRTDIAALLEARRQRAESDNPS